MTKDGVGKSTIALNLVKSFNQMAENHEQEELKKQEEKKSFNILIYIFDIVFISIFSGFGFMCLLLIVKANPIFSIINGFLICSVTMFFEARGYYKNVDRRIFKE
jgi:nitrate reductase NapE component